MQSRRGLNGSKSGTRVIHWAFKFKSLAKMQCYYSVFRTAVPGSLFSVKSTPLSSSRLRKCGVQRASFDDHMLANNQVWSTTCIRVICNPKEGSKPMDPSKMYSIVWSLAAFSIWSPQVLHAASNQEMDAAKVEVIKFFNAWDPPEDGQVLLNQAQQLEGEWSAKAALPNRPLTQFLYYGRNVVVAGLWVSLALRELVSEKSDDKVFLLKAVKAAIVIPLFAGGGAGMDDGGRPILNDLLQSKFPSVRREAAQSLLLWSVSPFGGSIDRIHTENARLYVDSYFSETDASVKVQLKELVRRYDPDALVFGPKGVKRTIVKCAALLGLTAHSHQP
jgi:hypothetical protein